MSNQNYFGLDRDDDDSWTLVQWVEGKTILVQQFEDSTDGLKSLNQFIRDRSGRPKVCLKSSKDSTLKLLACLCSIPDAEVVFVSEAGFQQYQAWFPKHRATPSSLASRNAFGARLLAQCAERMI
jgi:hypothetical protein